MEDHTDSGLPKARSKPEQELLEASADIITALRGGGGIDSVAVAKWRAALDGCSLIWRRLESVDLSLVPFLLEIAPQMSASAPHYVDSDVITALMLALENELIDALVADGDD
jgi:hypothetical protein